LKEIDFPWPVARAVLMSNGWKGLCQYGVDHMWLTFNKNVFLVFGKKPIFLQKMTAREELWGQVTESKTVKVSVD
jgi:hypothetical protein